MDNKQIITVTQCPSGGWWEGTLNGTTGWFPSNYCQPLTLNEDLIHSNDHNIINTTELDKLLLANNSDSDTQQYRNMVSILTFTPLLITNLCHSIDKCNDQVFQDIEDTESAYVRDLVETLNKYLKPLQQSLM